MHRICAAIVAAALGLGLMACAQAKSANPLSPSVAGPIPGVNITAPQTLAPAPGAEIVQSGEPVSLLIENPTTSGERPIWLSIELGADGAFQQVLHQADRVTPGEGGRTSYRIPTLLGAGYTYHWRVRAQDGANTGPWSSATSFRVVEPVVIEPPTPLEPIGNITTITPVFKIRNGQMSNTSNVVYRVEVGSAPDPGAIVAVLTVAPDPSGITSIAVGNVPYGTTYYWRAYATDGVTTSGFSNVVSFRTPNPPAGGGGGGGGGTGGGGGGGGGGGTGTGQRTPNPGPGQRLPLPGYGAGVVSDVAGQHPAALRNSCQDQGGTWEFMDRVVDRLRTFDSRWGYNGKRGNTSDPSHDIVDYNYGSQPDEGTTEVYIVDVMVGHCGGNPGPAWIDQTEVTYNAGTIGRWTSRGRF
jgi:hypothetical protein